MSLPVLTAVTAPWETQLAAGLDAHHEVQVVRRCADVAELLSVAGAGLARAAVVSADLDGVDADVLARLRRAGVEVVVVLVDPDAAPAGVGAGDLLVDPRARPPDRAGPQPGPGTPARPPGPWGVRTWRAAGTDPQEIVAVLVAEDAAVRQLRSRAGAPEGRRGRGDERSGSSVAGVVVPLSRHLDADHPPSAPGPPPPGGEPGSRGPALGFSGDPLGGRPGAASIPGGFATLVEPGPFPSPAGPPGRVVAVWGPAGAPGRTTIAVHLAAELALLTGSALIVDADTYASSVSLCLGLLDDGSGLAAAVRAATSGSLDVTRLAMLAPEAAPGLRVLTGLPLGRRWPELRASGLDALWPVTRELAAWTLIDCAFALEADEELSFDTAAPRRNQATLSALEAADRVLVVGAADPLGLQRLIRGLQELEEAVPGLDRLVVVTKVRASAVGSPPARRVREALSRFAGVHEVVLVPDDRPAFDAAMLAGRTLAEQSPQSSARRALADLARAWVLPTTDGERGPVGGTDAAGSASSRPRRGVAHRLGARRRRPVAEPAAQQVGVRGHAPPSPSS